MLQSGNSGSAVTQLQNQLNKAIDAGLVVDGSYGPATQAAVKSFQSQKGLSVTGIYDDATKARLDNVSSSSLPSISALSKIKFTTPVAIGIILAMGIGAYFYKNRGK